MDLKGEEGAMAGLRDSPAPPHSNASYYHITHWLTVARIRLMFTILLLYKSMSDAWSCRMECSKGLCNYCCTLSSDHAQCIDGDEDQTETSLVRYLFITT